VFQPFFRHEKAAYKVYCDFKLRYILDLEQDLAEIIKELQGKKRTQRFFRLNLLSTKTKK